MVKTRNAQTVASRANPQMSQGTRDDAISSQLQQRMADGKAEHIQLSIKSKLDTLYQLRKGDEPATVAKAIKLFEVSQSFAAIMLIKKNVDLYQEHLSMSLRVMTQLMEQQQSDFDLHSKNLVPMLVLLGFVYLLHGKHKLSLKCIHQAQEIIDKLDGREPRNIDYIITVHALAAIVMLNIGQPYDALQHISAAEEQAQRLINANVLQPLGLIQELSEGNSRHHTTKSEGDTQRHGMEQRPFGSNNANTNIQIDDPDMDKNNGGQRKAKVEFVFDNVNNNTFDTGARSKDDYNYDKTPTFADPRHARAFPDEGSSGPQARPLTGTDSRPGSKVSQARMRSRPKSRQTDHSNYLHNVATPLVCHASKISVTLLKNFLLALHLMKNIALRYTLDDTNKFDLHIAQDLKRLRDFENLIREDDGEPPKVKKVKVRVINGDLQEGAQEDALSVEDKDQETGIAFLLIQHKNEILDSTLDYEQVLMETLDSEFMNMLQMCIFVPFLHEETPRPNKVPKTELLPSDRKSFLPNTTDVRDFFNQRAKLMNLQDAISKKAEFLQRHAAKRANMLQGTINQIEQIEDDSLCKPSSIQQPPSKLTNITEDQMCYEPSRLSSNKGRNTQESEASRAHSKTRALENAAYARKMFKIHQVMKLPRKSKNLDELLKPKNPSKASNQSSQNVNPDQHHLERWSREGETDRNHYLKGTTLSKNSSSVDVNKQTSNKNKSFHVENQFQISKINNYSPQKSQRVHHSKEQQIASIPKGEVIPIRIFDNQVDKDSISFNQEKEHQSGEGGSRLNKQGPAASGGVLSKLHPRLENQKQNIKQIDEILVASKKLDQVQTPKVISQQKSSIDNSKFVKFKQKRNSQNSQIITANTLQKGSQRSKSDERSVRMNLKVIRMVEKQSSAQGMTNNQSSYRENQPIHSSKYSQQVQQSTSKHEEGPETNAEQVQNNENVSKQQQIQKQLEMNSTSPPSGFQAPTILSKPSSLTNQKKTEADLQTEGSINKSSKHNRSLSEYMKRGSFQKRQVQIAEEENKQATSESKKNQLPHQYIPVSNQNYTEVKCQMQNHILHLKKKEIIRKKAQGSSISQAAKKRTRWSIGENMRGAAEFQNKVLANSMQRRAMNDAFTNKENPQYEGQKSFYDQHSMSEQKQTSQNNTNLENKRHGSKTVLGQRVFEKTRTCQRNATADPTSTLNPRRVGVSHVGSQDNYQGITYHAANLKKFATNAPFKRTIDLQSSENQFMQSRPDTQNMSKNQDLNEINEVCLNPTMQQFAPEPQSSQGNRPLASQLQKTIDIYRQHRPATKGATSFHNRKMTIQPILSNNASSTAGSQGGHPTRPQIRSIVFPSHEMQLMHQQQYNKQNISDKQFITVRSKGFTLSEKNYNAGSYVIPSSYNQSLINEKDSTQTNDNNTGHPSGTEDAEQPILYYSRNQQSDINNRSDGGYRSGSNSRQTQPTKFKRSAAQALVSKIKKVQNNDIDNNISIVDPLTQPCDSYNNRGGQKSIYSNMGPSVDIDYYKKKLQTLEKDQNEISLKDSNSNIKPNKFVSKK